MAVKDNIDTAGVLTRCNSEQFATRVPDADAEVVRRLTDAGAIVVGKTHTHELAYGEICAPTRNAWDSTRLPGASSGGSAVAVASGMALGALGTDTGGSIRIPGSYNGIVGLKPTFGRVPRTGVMPLSWSLDHVGPMTRTVADAALLLRVVAGHDDGDPTSGTEPVPDYAEMLAADVSGLRVGVPRQAFDERVSAPVQRAFARALEQLADTGVDVRDVAIPELDLAPEIVFGILLPEASAYYHRMLREVPERFGADVRALLEQGELVPATRYLDAQRQRARLRDVVRRSFERHGLDALVVPTLETTAPPADVDEQWLMDSVARTCSAYNVTGQPAVTVPCGFDEERLPIGISFVGRPYGEPFVLRLAAAFERRAGWWRSAPALAKA